MNDLLNSLLADASALNQEQPAPSLGLQKQAAVANSAANKISALGGAIPKAQEMYAPTVGISEGYGSKSLSQEQLDYAGMDPISLGSKYGFSQAEEILRNRAQTQGLIHGQRTSSRDWSQTAADTVTDLALGTVGAVGGIAAIPIGAVNSSAGQAISEQLERLNTFGQSTQSQARQDRRSLLEATDQVAEQDNDQQFLDDLSNGDSGFMAGVKRIGRGVLNSGKNVVQDPINFGGAVVEGAGSLVALAPISRAAKAHALIKATAAKNAALAAGKTTDEAVAIGAAILAKEGSIAIPAAIGAMEAGGSYTGNVNEVVNMTHEQLMADSPAYADMIKQGVSPDEAKTTIGNRSGLMAAAITAPFAVAAGKLVSKFEANPLAIVGAKTAGRNIVKETVEEGIQGGTGALAQNVGIQAFADENKTLSTGVGEQIGRGAVVGAGMAGVLQAPSLALQSGKTAGKAALNAAGNQLQKITDAREEEARKGSPTSIENLTANATAATEQASAKQQELAAALNEAPDMTPEAKTQAQEYFSSLVQSLAITPEESEALGVPGATHKLDAMGKLIEKIKTSNNPEEKIKLGMGIHALVANLTPVLNDERNDLPDLPEQAFAILSQYDTIVQGAGKSKDVTDAMAEAAKAFQKPSIQLQMNQENQTQETADLNAVAAVLAPETVNPITAGITLRMAKEGKINLSEQQQQAIKVAQGLMQAAQVYDADMANSGLTPASAIVGKQVKTGEDESTNQPGEYSGLQHIRLIAGAMVAGKTNEARERLISLGKFAESQSNKVAAFNAHYEAGRGAARIPAKYVTATGDWKMSKKGYGVTPDKPGSIAFAKNVAAEARFLTNLYNNLAKAYPSLEQELMKEVELDTIFRGNAKLVATEFANNTRKYANEEKTIKSPAVVTSVNVSPTPVKKDGENEQIAKIELENKQPTDDEINAALTEASSSDNTSEFDDLPTEAVTPVKKKNMVKRVLTPLLDLLKKVTTGIDTTKGSVFVANKEQQEGIDKIQAFLKSDDDIFVLEGKAGTGKTSLVQEAIRPYLQKHGELVVISAVSHKAKALLKDKLNSFIRKNALPGKVKAASVAGLLGMRKNPKTGEFAIPVAGMDPKSPILNTKLIIVDEASMIDKKTILLIDKHKLEGAKVIYLGDRGQLSPIDPKAPGISPVFSINLKPEHRHALVTRVRQGEDSSILPYADNYWNNSDSSSPVPIPVELTDRNSTNELQFISPDQIEEMVMPLFKKAMETGNNNLVKIVAYNNKVGTATNAKGIVELEARIREVLFGEDAAEFMPGEFIIMNDSYTIPGGTDIIENSREFVAVNATPKEVIVRMYGKDVTVKAFTLAVKDPLTKETFSLPVLSKTDAGYPAVKAFLKGRPAEIRKLDKSDPKVAKAAWAEYFKVEPLFADADYSYAITSHKSQGSTYDVSVIIEDNFNAGFRGVNETEEEIRANNAERSRGIYTAITRASKIAVVVSSLNPTEDVVVEEAEAEVQKPAEAVKAVASPVVAAVPPVIEPTEEVTPVITPPVKQASSKTAPEIYEVSNIPDDVLDDAIDDLEESDTLSARLEQLRNERESREVDDSDSAFEIQEPAEQPESVAEAFPSLVGMNPAKSKTRNFLDKAFKIPKTIKSRLFSSLVGSLDPITVLLEALSSNEAISKFLGGKSKGVASEELLGQFRGFVSDAKDIADQVERNLQKAISTRNADSKKTGQKGEYFLLNALMGANSSEPTSNPNTKVTNIVEPIGKDKFRYNPALLKSATLAAMHWFLNTSSDTATIFDEKDVASILGISKDDVTDNQTNLFKGDNLLLVNVLRPMANQIVKFWGLAPNNDFDQSMVDGIPLAVATEILRAMVQGSLLQQVSMETEISTFNEKTQTYEASKKTVNFFKPNKTGYETKYPTLLAELVEIEAEEAVWFGDEFPKAAKNQLHNSIVENTGSQRGALTAEGSTPFFVNMPMFNLRNYLGKDFLLDNFGGGSDLSPKLHNKNNLESRQGRTVGVASAFEHIKQRFSELENHAEAAGIAVDEMPMRYNYNNSSVGRMQMQGSQSPQANKGTREVYMPNRDTIDLNDPMANKLYMLALAQMLGVKVHTKLLDDSINEVQTLLDGSLKEAIELLQTFHEKGSMPKTAEAVLSKAIEAAGGTDMALHAMLDYANMLMQGKAARKAYKTFVYLEADGVSNGPANSVAMLSSGAFTPADIERMGMGGLFLVPDKTMNQHRTEGTVDMYQKTTVTLQQMLTDTLAKWQASDKQRAGVVQLSALGKLMDMFLKDIVYDAENKSFEIARGAGKNPLTVTIYGAGEAGIANKVVNELMEEIYERYTQAAKRKAANPSLSIEEALFGDQASANKTAEQIFNEFVQQMNQLSQKVLAENKAGVTFIADYKIPSGKRNTEGKMIYERAGEILTADKLKDLNNFTLHPDNLAALTRNIKELYVGPLREAITQTVGASVLRSTSLIQSATQLQSLAMAMEFKALIQKKLTENKATSSHSGQFLSRNEQREIIDELVKKYPFVKTHLQEFFIAGSGNVQVNAKPFAAALDGTLASPAMIPGPDDAGVAGIPYLVIGMGDGLMMQILSTMQDAIKGTLKIFDGMNMPISQILKGSLQANEAVFKTWQGNPVRAVLEMFEKSKDSINAAYSQMQSLALTDPVIRDYLAQMERTLTEKDSKTLLEELRTTADSIDARHATLRRVAHSVDQMASAGQAYQNQGENISHLPLNEQVAYLNKVYLEELAKIKEQATVDKAERQGLIDLSNKRAITNAMLKLEKSDILQLAETSKRNLSADQKLVLTKMLALIEQGTYEVFYGTREELSAVHGQDLSSTEFGRTVTGDVTRVYVVKGSHEALVHELVHAGTINTILEYYQRPEGTKSTTDSDKAIERLELMMEQFKDLDTSGWTQAQQDAYNHTVLAIARASEEADPAVQKAIALNEFMAWGLANQNLREALEGTKTTPAAKMVKSIVHALKRIFYKLFNVTVNDKFYENLRFNSFVVAASQPTIARSFSDISLQHNTGYGTDANLIQIERNLSNKLVAFANTSPLQKPTALVQARRSFLFSKQVADAVRAIFPMTGQEYTTFQAITATLATEVSLDPNALVKAQDMYVHALKNLDARSFMQDPTSTNQAEEQASLEKYELLVGKSMILTDMNDRSSLLPVFLALGATNKEFRGVMNKIGMPKTVKHPGTTFDDYLRNYSNVVIDSLSNRASGTNKSKTVQEALDALNIKLYELAQQKESMLESLSAPVGSIISSANTRLVQMMTKLGEALYDKADTVATTSNNKWVKSGANIAKLFSGIASEKTASAVAEGVTNILNKVDGKQAIVDLFNDMVGRTESNANVYDMIKRVRTAIQQLRQNFRENVPEVIASKFTKKLTEKQFSSLFISMGKTDLVASATGRTFAQVAELLTDHSSLVRETKALENKIRGIAPAQYALYEAKMKQLANSMINGIDGNALLRNANAINALVGLDVVRQHSVDLTEDIDQLTTLYAIGNLSKEDIQIFSSLVRDGESDGLQFMFSYLKGQRKDEVAKAATGNAYYNAKKGFIPSVPASNMTLVVANDSDHAELVAKSYVRVGKYNGTPAEPNIHKSYYYLAASARPEFAQGIMQNVVHSSGGVNISTGLTIGTTAGIITDPVYLAKVWKRAKRATSVSTEGLVPVFDFNGDLIALERTLDPAQLHRMKYNTEIHKMIGVWRGRLVEEATSSMYNDALIKNLHDMYTEAVKSGKSDQYVNLFDIKDPVMVDAVKLLSKQVRDQMALITGTDEFFVRKTTLADALGYRNASVGDMWSGNSRWSPKTQEIVKNIAMGVMGNKAYRLAVNSEKVLTNFVSSAKSTIVVKSVIVPAANIVANLYYLVSRNVSPFYMKDKAPQKIQEIEAYVKSNIRLVEAEAELRAFADDKLKSSKLEAEIKSINDAHKRLSIWPLLEAGEFSSISDVGLNHEDVDIAEGKWVNYLDAQVDKLPLNVRNAGRYAWVTQDTALFQGLQKMVQYGDFLGKAILYDDLIENKGLTSEQALARITEEFVNYDRLPGRFRGYMEQIGLLWFYNFKIRIMKVALSTIRNNPLHALLVGMVPTPEFLTGPIGSPMTDNGLYKAIDGSLDNSIGMGQGFNAPFLNPLYNLMN